MVENPHVIVIVWLAGHWRIYCPSHEGASYLLPEGECNKEPMPS